MAKAIRLRTLCLGTVLVGAIGAQQASATTVVANYLDSAGSGFYDATYGAQRRAAFDYALNIWSGVLADGYAGETLVVDATFSNLGGVVNGGITLGSAGPDGFYALSGDNLPPTAFAAGLANHLIGEDIDEGTESEIFAQFNTRVDTDMNVPTRFYYGLDANPGAGQVDFVSVVLHEVGHGLGLLDTIAQNGSWLLGIASIYDRYLVERQGSNFEALDQMTNAQRAAAIVSDELYWAGQNGVAANGGFLPVIYAPTTYQDGSSVGHLDETIHGSELMSPFYSGPDHTIGALSLAMLEDIGWTIVPEPTAAALLGLGTLVLVGRRRAA